MTGSVIRILLIGPLPPPMGGDTRHFETLVRDLYGDERFSVKVINTSRGREHSRLLRNFAVASKTVVAIIFNLRRVDIVSYHASDRGMFLLGPVIVLLGKASRRPTILRVFGGSFGNFYEGQSRTKKTIIRKFILTADVVLLQTQRVIRQLQSHATGRLVWFSTYIKSGTRPPNKDCGEARALDRECTRFVFLGHLWRTKGLETILEAASEFPTDCTIDIYGSLDEYTEEQIRVRGMGRVHYRGFLTHDEVDAILWNYDCLVLPTYHAGEGYPGVIAEAYAHGLPVITTRWLAIPEIVDEDCGILIEPRDTQAFIDAVRLLNQDKSLWLKLKEGARARAKKFDHVVWARKFEEICEGLVVN